MDQRRSYDSTPEMLYGVISNTITLVNWVFLVTMDYERLCAETRSLSLKLSSMGFLIFSLCKVISNAVLLFCLVGPKDPPDN